MTHQQELELLAEWLGIEIAYVSEWNGGLSIMVASGPDTGPREWDPSPTGNSDDFLNMVAGRVDIKWFACSVEAHCPHTSVEPQFELLPDDATDAVKTAAMKHAAYQVCLTAAKEWKEDAR